MLSKEVLVIKVMVTVADIISGGSGGIQAAETRANVPGPQHRHADDRGPVTNRDHIQGGLHQDGQSHGLESGHAVGRRMVPRCDQPCDRADHHHVEEVRLWHL